MFSARFPLPLLLLLSLSLVALRCNGATDSIHQSITCGQTSAYIAAKCMGVKLDANDEKELTSRNLQLHTLYDISLFFKRKNVRCNAYRCNVEQIQKLDCPIIAHMRFQVNKLEYEHFTTIVRFDKVKGFLIVDLAFDATEPIWMTVSDFEKMYTGTVLTFDQKGR